MIRLNLARMVLKKGLVLLIATFISLFISSQAYAVGPTTATFDFESGIPGYGSGTVIASQAVVTSNGTTETLVVTCVSDKLVNSTSLGLVPVMGTNSLSNNHLSPMTSLTFSLQSGNTFDLTSFMEREDFGQTPTVTITTAKGTSSFSIYNLSKSIFTHTFSGNTAFQGITSFTITSNLANNWWMSFDNIVLNNIARPTITSVTPNRGLATAGTVVTITGTNFSGVSAVNFGTLAAASYTVNSPSSITAIAPSVTSINNSQTVDITVTTAAGGTSAATTYVDQFTFDTAFITGLSPKAGPMTGGTAVTISGGYFTGATAVSIGTVPVASFTVVNDSTITAVTGSSITSGLSDITVKVPSGTGNSNINSIYFNYSNPPTVTSLIPNIGPTAGGTAVTINGTNFVAPATVTIGGVPAASVSVLNNITITAVTPPNASGVANVVVTTPGGIATGSGLFNYTDAPTITSIGQNMGSESGGTWIGINGANFTGVTGVKFGVVPAASYSVWSTTSLSALSPPGTGIVDVTVITTNATTAITPADQFTYIPPPTIASISPNIGSIYGGSTVVITGTNFTGLGSLPNTGVMFGNTYAMYIVNSPTQITATAPYSIASGTVDIRVINPTSASAISAADKFTYIPLATITSASPAIGPATGGTSVVITGTDFIGVTSVRFGIGPSVNASYTVNSPTQITAIAPPLAGVNNIASIDVTTVSGMSMPSLSLFTYVSPPIANVAPSIGSASGGTTVWINGSNFINVTSVKFGALPAASYTVTSVNQITATAPPGTGTVGVTVTALGGTNTINLGNQFTYVPPPTITSISPAAGPDVGGSSVVITGTDFTGVTAVNFGALPAASYTVNSATQITAIAPFRGSPGVVDITVAALGGTNAVNAADQFTYSPLPTVTSITPAMGPSSGGTSVVITGTNFIGVSAVKFGAVAAASYTVNSATQITAISPAGSYTVDVAVTTSGGISLLSLADKFTYVFPPQITGRSPAAGPTVGGTSVIIYGTDFTGVTSVKFGAVAAASYTVNSTSQITAISPPGTGVADILVTALGGTSSYLGMSYPFTYAAAPAVTGISPATGPEVSGTNVVITGTGFTGVSAVNFGAISAASYTVNSATQITATAPAGTGIVDITVTTSGGITPLSLADQFTHVPVPTVTSVSPATGPAAGGTNIVITGTNFTGVSSVKFGTTPASFIVNSPTQITATVPMGIGIVDITVSAIGGTSVVNVSDQFTYVPTPTVAGIAPNSGPVIGGTAVTITGTNLNGTTVVNFGAMVAASYTVNSATQVTAIAPSGIGTVNITITTAGGTSALNALDQFTYGTTVTGITPNVGLIAGGMLVTITGTNFTGATSVTIGGTAATGITVVNPTTITAIAPPGTAGPQNVVVTTPTGTGTGTGLFTYITAPTVTGIAPTSGSYTGGTLVTITGTNFTGATSVAIGSSAATGITVVNSTTITAIVPPGTAGPQNIIVTAPGGIGTGIGLFTYIGAAAGFRITSITQQTAGGAFSVTITATDGLGNTDVAYQPVNNLHFVTTAGVAPNGVSVPVLPVDSKPVFVNGVATITGFTLYKAETAVTISVSELTTAKTGTSNLFNVDPAPAATLRVQ